MTISALRVQNVNDKPVQNDGEYILYWMIANRRPMFNPSLERAVGWAEKLGKPLLILEALRVGYPWASDRLHAFILQGMADNKTEFQKYPVTYYPYVEETHGAGKGLVETLSQRASLIVTDDFPSFFLPRMVAALASKVNVRVESIDSNGLLPMRAAHQVFPRAYDFRRFLQRNLLPYLTQVPAQNPLQKAKLPPPSPVDSAITKRWPEASPEALAGDPQFLNSLPIDHAVPITETPGGHRAARQTMKRFLSEKLARYGDERNEPEKQATSGFSPYLHFGHLSVHDIWTHLVELEAWSPESVSKSTAGKREGWWGMSPNAESFLDELVTWRELGYNMAYQRADHDQYSSLPDWAKQTLADHARDPRPHVYTLEQFENAQTHDPVWNAAQNQIRQEGRIHNYMRMLWGKKVLEWSRSPEEAVVTLIELNNKYGLDGRNPNSYSGIFWVFGRYDRPWGPERPIFGKIRYMSSENTGRKFALRDYLARYNSAPVLF